MCLLVLIDSRLKPQQIDLDFITWLGMNAVPFSVVFTKTDKLNQMNLSRNIHLFEDEMLKTWEELPPAFMTSSLNKTGKEEVLDYLEKIITQQFNF